MDRRALGLLLLACACRPRAGSSCSKSDAVTMTCSGPSSALVCVGGRWTTKPCAQPCSKLPDPQGGTEVHTVCDDVADPTAGDPCYLAASVHGMPADESARDGSAVLACRLEEGHAGGGRWTVSRMCTAGARCLRERGPYCTTP